MNESLTVVIERNVSLDSAFETEPYEAAWAREARWFLVLEEDPHGLEIRLDTEISPDGLDWCQLESAGTLVVGQRVSSWSVGEFGGWLRLRGSVTGQAAPKGSIYLALKA